MLTPRWVWVLLLVLAAIPIGFAVGAWIGARFLIPADAGLVGGAMLFWYGVLGMVLALVAGIIAIRGLGPSPLKLLALVAAGLAVVLLALVGLRINQQQVQPDAHRQLPTARIADESTVVSAEIDTGLPPACWPSPQMLYFGAPPPELAERVHLARVSDHEAEEIVVHNPDTTRPGPWRAALDVPLSDGDVLRVLLDGVTGPIQPREFGSSLVYLRVPWGRTTFSDLLLDRKAGAIIGHEQVIDGTDAWHQARESCALPELADDASCDCAISSQPWPRPRAQAHRNSTLGLLLLPGLFGPGETGGVVATTPIRALAVYSAPDGGLDSMRQIEDFRELHWREYAYEAGAAVVTGRQGDWLRIELADGSNGWVRPGPAEQFLSLAELYAGTMTHLVRTWSGRLWRQDRGGWYADPSGHVGETAVEVVATETIGDTLWLEVVIPEIPPCGGGRQQSARGWIPAWDENGELNVWFYSRGC